MERESSHHAEIIAAAKKMYKSIGPIACPVLGGEIVSFTDIGFSHLLRRGKAVRPKTEQVRRLGLLPYAKEIINRLDLAVEYREIRKGFPETCHFWGLTAVIDNKEITVVIRQIGKGSKCFFSIMDSDIKKTP